MVVAAKLRKLAPYAAMELVLPGGSVMALLCGFIEGKRSSLSFESARPAGSHHKACVSADPYVDLRLWVKKIVTCECPSKP